MTDRQHVEALDAELARRTEAEERMATALVELESHPGHRLLSTITATGRTASRWSAARTALDTLWQDFSRYRAALAEARDVRARRSRPHGDELEELGTLLLEPSIEVGRVPVALPERLHTTATERVQRVSLAELGTRIDTAFDEVSTLVVEVDTAYQRFCTELKPLRERLEAARGLVDELGLHTDDPLSRDVAAQAARADELERAAATDPLALDEGSGRDVLTEFDAALADVRRRLDGVVAVRDGWPDELATVVAELNQLEELSASEQRERLCARERIAGAGLSAPRDRLPELRSQLSALENTTDWSQRAAALDELRAAMRTADGELRAAHDFAAGLVRRRSELRGRHEAYRAKSVRLGHAEHPEVLELEEQLGRLLWTRPCDLEASTRVLASYQRLVTQPPRST